MKLTKEILEEEIQNTKDTLETLAKTKEDQTVRYNQLMQDCDVGLALNKFVLEKLEEQLNSMQ